MARMTASKCTKSWDYWYISPLRRFILDSESSSCDLLNNTLDRYLTNIFPKKQVRSRIFLGNVKVGSREGLDRGRDLGFSLNYFAISTRGVPINRQWWNQLCFRHWHLQNFTNSLSILFLFCYQVYCYRCGKLPYW